MGWVVFATAAGVVGFEVVGLVVLVAPVVWSKVSMFVVVLLTVIADMPAMSNS